MPTGFDFSDTEYQKPEAFKTVATEKPSTKAKQKNVVKDSESDAPAKPKKKTTESKKELKPEVAKESLDTVGYNTVDSIVQERVPVLHEVDGNGIHEPILPGVADSAKVEDTSIFASSFPPMFLAFVILIVVVSILGCLAQVFRNYREERNKYIKKVAKANLKDKDALV